MLHVNESYFYDDIVSTIHNNVIDVFYRTLIQTIQNHSPI